MTNMQTVTQLDAKEANPVSSFEVGIMSSKETWVGVCIKFSMYDKTCSITHWPLHAYDKLTRALTEFVNSLGNSAFMFQAVEKPSLVEGLPARHPYHTLLTEKPTLSVDEIGKANADSSVKDAEFAIRGTTFEIRPILANETKGCIRMHEYTAFSLLGYLNEYMEAAVKLSGPVAGNA